MKINNQILPIIFLLLSTNSKFKLIQYLNYQECRCKKFYLKCIAIIGEIIIIFDLKFDKNSNYLYK
jgi:hypothetical protein